MAYTWFSPSAVARHRESLYNKHIMYCPLTAFLVCQQTCRAPHNWICPSKRTLDLILVSKDCVSSVKVDTGHGRIKDRTWSGKINRSCSNHVFSTVTFTDGSSVARLISAVASRNRTRTFSIWACEFGQSYTGVCFSSSAKSSGYLQIRWIGWFTLVGR